MSIDYSKWDSIVTSSDEEDDRAEEAKALEDCKFNESGVEFHPPPWTVRTKQGQVLLMNPHRREWPDPHETAAVTVEPGTYQIAHQEPYSEITVPVRVDGKLFWKLNPHNWCVFYIVQIETKELIVVWDSEDEEVKFKDRSVKRQLKHALRVLVKPGTYPLDKGLRNWYSVPQVDLAYLIQKKKLRERKMFTLKTMAKGQWRGVMSDPMTGEKEIMIELEGNVKIAVKDGDFEREYQCAVCGRYARKWCGRCKALAYCCMEHQKEDWKNHKKICKRAKKSRK